MDDLVDRERRSRPVGMVAIPGGERFGDLVKPLVELFSRTRVQRGKAADDARGALSDHQLGVGYDEHWRADHRDAQTLKNKRQAHSTP
jgi:hypothetical protein